MKLSDLLKLSPAAGTVLGGLAGGVVGTVLMPGLGTAAGAGIGSTLGGAIGGAGAQIANQNDADIFARKQEQAIKHQQAEALAMQKAADELARKQVIQDLLSNFLKGR